MDEQLTATLSPALSHIIERPRLIERIREADARVVFFVAPAGYGKTTLARQWSERQTGPVVWHRTTRASGDIAALAVRLDDALDAAVPQPHRDPRRVASIASVNPHPTPLSRALVATYAGLTDDVLLIVDEWEAAGTPEAEELLRTLVEELKIRFLLTSRTRPPWFTSRLKVYGEALEIGMDELTMTDEEAASALRSVPDHEDLLKTACGWPAVVGLAAMRASADVTGSGPSGTALAEFLASELIDCAPQDVQQAAMLIAAAETHERHAAEALLGSDAPRLLEGTTCRGLVLADGGGALSIHPLIKKALITRLGSSKAGPLGTLLEHADRLIRAQSWDETLSLVEATRDGGLASKALQDGLDLLLRSGRLETARRLAAVARLTGTASELTDLTDSELAWRSADFDRAIGLATKAAAALHGDRAAQAHVVAARAAYLSGRHNETQLHAEVARSLADTRSTRAAALWVSFVDAAEDEARDAPALLSEYQSVVDDSSEQALRMSQGALILGLFDGQLEGALDSSEIAQTLLTADLDPLVGTSFLDKRADALCAAGRYAAALEAVLEEERLAREFGLDFCRRYLLVHKSRALVGLRRFGAAERALSELARALRTTPDAYLAAYAAVAQSSLYVSVGDLRRATASLLVDMSQRQSKVLRGTHAAFQGVVLAAAGATSLAEEKLAEAGEASQSAEVRAFSTTGAAVLALCEGDQDTASERLDEVLGLPLRDPLVLGFRAAPALLRHAASTQHNHDLLMTMLSRSSDDALARQVGLPIPRSPLRSQALSPREFEIHGLIAQGLTNHEIARLLFISDSTTKVHVRHILEKLGVRSRVEAARIWETPEGSVDL